MCVESQFDTEAICDMVFRQTPIEDRLVSMIHECFLDDSKDQRQEFLYVCGGFHGSQSAWKRFDKEWNLQLRAEGIEYFKTSEFKSLTKQFSRYRLLPEPHGRDGASLIRGRLQDVLSRCSGIHAVAVVVPVEDHQQVMKHESANVIFGDEVYHRAFESTILKATNNSCRGSDWITFAHDDGQDFEQLRQIYHSFKEKNPDAAKKMRGFIPLDDKFTPGLQIADMFANSVMNRTHRQMTEGDADSREIFMFDRAKIYVWSQRFGEIVLAANLKSRGITIPATLLEAQKVVDSFGIERGDN
jgi:Protein of unknown function (DUF3800)